MRSNYLKKLEIPYDQTSDADEHKFAKAIAAALPKSRNLRSAIYNDLSPDTFGISWWNSYSGLGQSRKILISDQLWQSLSSLQSNVIEAKVQLLELAVFWDSESAFMKDSVTVVNGKPVIKIPPKLTPKDDLPGYLADLHLKGFLSSICSAMDCLSAVIVGVMGFKENLLKVGFGSLERHFIEKFSYANPDQIQFVQKYKEIISSAGPSGWLIWAMDYRNMAMHRGRRLRLSQLKPCPSGILNSKGQMGITTEVVQCLVRNPGVSEIESLKDGALETLSEPAETTLNEIFCSSLFTIEEVCTCLLAVWSSRRANPSLIAQPKEQWPRIRNGNDGSFIGYKPGTLETKMGMAVTSPAMVHRLKCASLAGNQIEQWKRVDWE